MSGHYRCYIEKNFRQETLDTIGQVNQIVEEYESKGFSLTVRQIHYQFVSRDWYANTGRNYSRLQDIISDGRLAGLISWTAVEDRGRNLMGLSYHVSPQAAIKETRRDYRIDLWADQDWRPEIWCEKQALEGVVAQISNRLRVDFFSCKGYNSQSEQWRAGRRFADRVRRGQRPIVFHLGDHDPIDMTRDNRDRLTMFAGTPVTFQRLALNWSQIEQYRPPPNPAKMADSRAEDYVSKYGGESWELDALDPTVIQDLIESAVGRLRDPARWDAALAREVDDLRFLDELVGEGSGTTEEED